MQRIHAMGGDQSFDPGTSLDTKRFSCRRVEQHTYRACDAESEVIHRVKESFQQLGYFCADVEPIAVQQDGKNQYNITIHVQPGEKYRVGELNFTGATTLSADELRSELHLKPNSVFNTES